jgi:GT2 family glycosyltransferase
VPQPTVFFRRRLLSKCGVLDESYQFIFDFELFWRFARSAKVRKIERTQAFYRIHDASKTTSWDRFLVELYRFSRAQWPSVGSTAFAELLRSYVGNYMRRRVGLDRHRLRHWPLAALVSMSALTGIGNPETWPERQMFKRFVRRAAS